jgi:HAE1 family hydrophobic/amphiphilic exporter-1
MIGIIDFFCRKRVLTHLIFIFLFLWGIATLHKIPMEAFPDMNFGTVVVVTYWPGADAADVEARITIPLEESISGVNYILRMVSTSAASLSKIVVKFDESLKDADYEKLHTEVQSKLREVRGLPPDCEPPISFLVRTQDWRPVISIAITGDTDELIMKKTARWLQEELQNYPGIQRVRLSGTRKEQVSIELDLQKLRQHSLSISDLINTVQSGLTNLSAGLLETEKGQADFLRVRNEPQNLSDFRQISLKSAPGHQPVQLSDIAKIKRDFEKPGQIKSSAGEEAVFLLLQKKDGENAVRLVPRIRAFIKEFQQRLPENIRLNFFNDSTTIIKRMLGILTNNLFFGIILVFFCLWFFIGFGHSLLAVIGIPFCFLTAFIFLDYLGITLNSISVVSLVIVSGMVVDDAIIILENMVTHFQSGKDHLNSAIHGTYEVLAPVLSSTMTTIAAFLPMIIMTGEVGRVMVIVPITVSAVLFVSVLEAFFILPCHYTEMSQFMERFFKKPLTQNPQKDFREILWDKTCFYYRRILSLFIRRPLLSAMGITLFFVLAAGLPYGFNLNSIPVKLFVSDGTDLWVNITTRPENTIEKTAGIVKKIELELQKMLTGDLDIQTSIIGKMVDSGTYEEFSADHLAQITLNLKSDKERKSKRSVEEIMSFIKAELQKQHHAGVTDISVVRMPDGPLVGKPVAVRLSSRDTEILPFFTQQIKKIMADTKGIINIDSDLKTGRHEYDIIIDETAARNVGLSKAALSREIAVLAEGLRIGFVYWGDEELDVRLKLQAGQINNLPALLSRTIMTPAGEVGLNELISVQNKKAYLWLRRYNQKRTVTITADLDPALNRTALDVLREIEPKIRQLTSAEAGLLVTVGGEAEETDKSLASLRNAFFIAAFLIYLILASQFNSFTQPVLIMLAIPYAFFGVLFGMGILSQPFTMLAMIGMVGLAGVVVNDTIVMVDFINRHKDEKEHVTEVVLSGASARLRAIFLTTFSTVLGLSPIVFGIGGSSIIWRPMAIAVSFGIVFATILTLFLLPCLYLIHQRLINNMVSSHP